jgi:hypothetical protein
MENKDLVRLALDTYHGNVRGDYANQNPSDVLRQALIAANGGSSKFDMKAMRRNKVEIFEIIEEILPILIQEGLQGDEFFMNLVEQRQLSAGDTNEFIADDNSTFIVSEMADGIATPRRQRIGAKRNVTIDTFVHGVRIFDELSRFLAGRVDWNQMVNKVAVAYQQKLLNDAYTAFSGITSTTTGLNSTYIASGVYSESAVLDIVEHVEASTGKTASIVGTKAALRKCTSAIQSEASKTELYNIGYYGKLAGVPMVSIKNRHAVGTDTFIFPDNKLFILASDDKPIKIVQSGETYISDKDGSTNADMTMEYLMIDRYGVGLLINGKLGSYTITG